VPETATTLVGRTLARYRVVERLGEGGMGAVYRAWDERLQRDVALKVLSHELLERRDARNRLREEARLLSQLAHPAIATVYDFDAHDEIEFLVMELVRGQTLEQRIAAGPLPEAEVVDLALQICEALEAAHERGIIHRDLKPANVMVTARGRVKVLDFGLATCCMEDDTDDLSQASTRPLTLEGTVPYMSPEQLLGRPVDERTDVFSLGAVLYEMFSGVPPFAGATLPALTDAILRQPVAPLAQKRAGLAPGMAVAVERCLEKRVEDRYPDARALAEDLRRAAAGGAVEKPRRVRVARIRDPEAHRHYLRGRRQWSKRTRAGLMQAIEQFEAAIDLDPEHAQAYSGLADSYAILAPWLPPRLGHQKSRAAARRALELDPDSAEAHTSLAFTDLFADWNWTAAEAGFRRALQLDPTYATGHQWYAELLTALGRFDEALEQASAAEDLDALSYAMPTTLVNVFYYARRYDEALEHHRRMVALGSPDSGLGGIADRARILEQSGHAEEAVTEYRAALKLDDDPRIRAGLACALALAGHPSAARNEMALLDSEAGVRHVPPYAIAGPLALLGDKDRAFERLEEAFTTRDRGMVWIRVNPRFDPLRDDARFASLLARMGFPG
jgi:serine/threonine protein kinase